MGAQLSEILNEELESKESGFSRRRVVKGVVWTVPVLVTAVGAPPASASPGPVVTPPPTPATGSISTGTQNVTSTVSSAHNRTGVTVPAALSLKNLSNVTGEVRVVMTISAPSPAPIISFSTVKVGTATPSITRPTATQAEFAVALPAGATTLDFAFSEYSYTGKKQDAATYTVTTAITYIQGGTSIQMSAPPSSSISLPKAG